MAKSFLLEPQEARGRLTTRYRNQRKNWLAGDGDWPLTQTLGPPTQEEAMANLERVRAWCDAWSGWQGPGQIRWGERRWPALGAQMLPEALVLETPAQVAMLTGLGAQWEKATQRLRDMITRWPALADELPAHYEVLANWDDLDFERLTGVLECLAGGDWRGHYIRQLPIPGIDSKWLESRQALLGRWLARIQGQAEAGDLYTLAGLRSPPSTLRLRLLDPLVREHFGGVSDIQVPPQDLAATTPPIQRVFIVENLQTGLAFTDLPGAAVFMKQGYAVELFGQIPWLKHIPCHYWGDLDTHGFAILDRLRTYLPHARSSLMDEFTLLRHKNYWAHESKPTGPQQLPRLSAEEGALYLDLKRGRFGPGVRLEQERVDWGYAWERIGLASRRG